MTRFLRSWAALVAIVAALPAAGRAASVSRNLDTYVLFAFDDLKARDLVVDNGDLGVNEGTFRARLVAASSSQVAGNTVIERSKRSKCEALFTNATQPPTCAAPTPFAVPIIADPVAACGFQPVVDCSTTPGAPVSITGGSATLPPGTYGAVVVPNEATLRLSGGTYRFCTLEVGRKSKLVANASARVNVAGDVKIHQRSCVGSAASCGAGGGTPGPVTLEVFAAGSSVNIQHRTMIAMELCAPEALLKVATGAMLAGRYVAERIRVAKIKLSRADCGNGVQEGKEECDGSDLDGAVCTGTGPSCSKPCKQDCTLDRRCCTPPTTTTVTSVTSTTAATTTTSTTLPCVCGDGIVNDDPACNDDGEECDPGDPDSVDDCDEDEICLGCKCHKGTTTTTRPPTTTTSSTTTTSTTKPKPSTTTTSTTSSTRPPTTSTTSSSSTTSSTTPPSTTTTSSLPPTTTSSTEPVVTTTSTSTSTTSTTTPCDCGSPGGGLLDACPPGETCDGCHCVPVTTTTLEPPVTTTSTSSTTSSTEPPVTTTSTEPAVTTTSTSSTTSSTEPVATTTSTSTSTTSTTTPCDCGSPGGGLLDACPPGETCDGCHCVPVTTTTLEPPVTTTSTSSTTSSTEPPPVTTTSTEPPVTTTSTSSTTTSTMATGSTTTTSTSTTVTSSSASSTLPGPTSTTTTSTSSTVVTIPSGTGEICGDCLDNDGDGFVDYDDSECCGGSFSQTLRIQRSSLRRRSGGTKFDFWSTIVPGAPDTALSQNTAFQISQNGMVLLCALAPASKFMVMSTQGKVGFWDKRHMVASAKGISDISYAARKSGVTRFHVVGPKVLFPMPSTGQAITFTQAFVNPNNPADATCQSQTQNFVGSSKRLKYP